MFERGKEEEAGAGGRFNQTRSSALGALTPPPPSPPPPPSLEKQSSFPWDGVHRLNMMICLRERLLNATARCRRLSHIVHRHRILNSVCMCMCTCGKGICAFYSPDGLWKGFVCPCIHGNMSTFFFFLRWCCMLCPFFNMRVLWNLLWCTRTFTAEADVWLQYFSHFSLKTHAAFSTELSVFCFFSTSFGLPTPVFTTF